MVETRRAKAARLARDVAEGKTEIRLMIYKEAWTTVRPFEHDMEAQLEGKPVGDHIKLIHALISICRLVRHEVLPQYFARTQAHVLYADSIYRCRGDARVLAAMRDMKRSRLFTEHLKHVRLHWLTESRGTWRTWLNWLIWWGMGDPDAKEREEARLATMSEQEERALRQVNTLEWLASLKSLQTLEIAFIDTRRRMGNDPAVYFGPDSVAWRELLKLPKLERISFLVYCRGPYEWKDSGRSVGRKEILEKGLLKDPAAKKEGKPLRIDVHVGAVRDVDSLPKLFEIS
ncbi:hypothetical protein N0V85_002968 [Neurospora sp. IMI 360204]|nr:hypothetical protein N0V85_002968 [Neurospora sp. IMI 360204]